MLLVTWSKVAFIGPKSQIIQSFCLSRDARLYEYDAFKSGATWPTEQFAVWLLQVLQAVTSWEALLLTILFQVAVIESCLSWLFSRSASWYFKGYVRCLLLFGEADRLISTVTKSSGFTYYYVNVHVLYIQYLTHFVEAEMYSCVVSILCPISFITLNFP